MTKLRLTRGFAAKAEKKAEALREELGLRPYDPLCAFQLCKHLAIEVFVAEQVDGLSSSSLTALSEPTDSGWSAVTIPYHESQRATHLIIHNCLHTPPRQQSNVMHEVAHILCGHEVSAIDINMGFPAYMRHYPEQQELEAESLGATLQLPRPALLVSLHRGWDQQAIMKHYQASAAMVRMRLNKTGVERQASYSR